MVGISHLMTSTDQYPDNIIVHGFVSKVFPKDNLINSANLPASPFRTDDWPLFDPDAEIVTVAKPAQPEGHISTDWKRPEMTQ